MKSGMVLSAALLAAVAGRCLGDVLAAHPGPANNGLTSGTPAMFFDLEAIGSNITVTHLKTASNTPANGTYSVEVFVRSGTGLGGPVASGPGSSPTGWTSLGTVTATQGAVASGVSLDIDIPDIVVGAGQVVGVALRFTASTGGGGPRYFGTTTVPPTVYQDSNLKLTTGEVRSVPFTTTGSYFVSRQLVGDVTYSLGGTVGGCCLSSGATNCIVTTQANCTNQGGVYAGDGTDCVSANCAPLPTGACCKTDGSCEVLTAFACSGIAGATYAGNGVTCVPANCPQPGACCLPNFVCSVMLASACTTAGGTFQGPSTACSSCPNPPAGSVAIYAADSATNLNDVQAKLVGTGLFPAVVLRNITSPAPTPTLADLQQYAAVLVYSNQSFTSGADLGNVMADYIDAGGGVVNCVFSISTTTANRFLAGRWDSNYQILVQNGGNTSGGGPLGLGTIHQPGHPILNGVATFSGGTSSFRPTGTTLTSHGSLVADWTGAAPNKMLIAVSTTQPRRVDLGFVPYSTTVTTTGWDASTDGAKIMANALLYAGRILTPPCYANCDGSTGSPLLTANDFQCFLNKFAASETYANCDGSTGSPLLTANDFQCFLNKFAAGCS